MYYKGKRKDGRYEAVVYVPNDTGKKKPKSLYAHSEAEVKAMAYQLELDILQGKYIATSKTTFENYMEKWFNIHKKSISEATAENYKYYMDKHIIPGIGKFKLQELKHQDIQNFYNNMLASVGANTVKHAHTIVNQVLETAVKNELIYRNPAQLVDLPKITKFKPKIYDEKTYRKFVSKIKDSTMKIAVLLAGNAGLRKEEILGLRWKDIDYSNKKINIEQVLIRLKGRIEFKKPKTDLSERTFYIDDSLIQALKEHQKKQEADKLKHGKNYERYGLVVCQENGKYYRPDMFYHLFIKAVKETGSPIIRFHDLRHYNASQMARKGIPIKTAMKRLGHARVETLLDIYTHSDEEQDRKAAKKLGKMYKL